VRPQSSQLDFILNKAAAVVVAIVAAVTMSPQSKAALAAVNVAAIHWGEPE
jgi:hypothetical protein